MAALPAAPASAGVVAATLVKQTSTGQGSTWDAKGHPSPDPSGITYNSRTGQLIISDGEVEETGPAYPNNVWRGTNLFVADLKGNLVTTGLDTMAYTPEPTGVGFRPRFTASSGHTFPERLFVSDDDRHRVFEVAAGPDGAYGNGDDTQTSFDVAFLGHGPEADAEDVAVDLETMRNGQLLIIDGLNKRVFVYNPGPDRAFNGQSPAGDDYVERVVDVGAYGAGDPEGIAYNPSRNTVLVLDDSSNKLYELALNGALLNTVTLPFTMKSGAGIALAPASSGSGGQNAYIVDRGVDNDSSQTTFNDGRLYEIAIPGILAGGTTPPPPPPGSGSLDIPIRAQADDAEQKASGSMTLTSGDLNLGQDATAPMTAGMRFTGVGVPKGSTITNAWVQFQADEAHSGATDLRVRAQTTGNAAAFTTTSGDITSRPLTSSSVGWQPAAWPLNARSAAQRTPNLAPVLQPVVNGAAWASGNALVLVVSGTGERTAESFDGGAAKAPVLHIEYGPASGTGTANAAPTVSAGPDSSVVRPGAATLSGSVTDDGKPSGSTTSAWSRHSGPGTVAFGDARSASTTATFSAAGTYVLRLTGSDGALSATNDVTVTVTEPAAPPPSSSTGVLEIPVRAGADDAEERSSGVTLGSGDMNLVVDGSKMQTVGLRFAGVQLPRGATVTNAYVQFQVDEVSTGAANLRVAGQAADDAASFTTVAGNISGRQRTAASVAWVPESWPTAGARTAGQRTTDLSAVVQEIVNRGGWGSGNALALIVTGTGERIAESFEGGAARAPVLHVEYRIG
ncbi:hypothetical protein [Blastococcus sp. LR1]|uniref:PKD domain-containing protein n=1 Tax=Blastococcus sp. LR1 TaxID=2877000 RepID=UPI001CCBEDAD|nr:hypothetical protein [Blastococcus sp. LR1]MCA0144865.1 hypothetical protein [Blastococcus sp. LR1]